MIPINRKKIIVFSLALLLTIATLFIAPSAQAQDWAINIVSGLLGVVISALGVILILVMKGLVLIAGYQHFIDSQAVVTGWVIVRDICNMFFVLVLLVIAFGTILHLENYSYKKWLPKLILMAVLINFSKTICGLMIDAAQIVMLTFVNAFKDAAGGNLIDALGISAIVTLAKSSSPAADFWTVVGAYLLGMIYLIVSVVVIVTMIMMLTMRLVMIWIYVVLSPVAYLGAAFPGGQKFASQWWSEFTKNLIVGPVLAFFIWLSLSALTADNRLADEAVLKDANDQTKSDTDKLLNISTGAVAGTEASTPSALIKFVVAIGMLVGGLKVSQEIGGAAGGLAGKGMAKLQKGAALTGGFALGRAKAVGGAVGRTARNTSLGVASLATRGLGNKIGGKAGGALKDVGNIGLTWRSDMIAKRKKDKQEKREKFLTKMGMGEKTMGATSDFLKTNAGKAMSTASHGAIIGATVGAAFGGVGSVIGAGVGGLAGAGFSRSAGRKKEKYNKKADQSAALAASFYANERTAPDPATAAIHRRNGDKATKASERYKKRGEKYGAVQSFTSETTQKAAANGSKDIANAKQNVKNASTDVNDFMESSTQSTFHSTGGKAPAEFFKQLTSKDNPHAGGARRDLETWVNTLDTIPGRDTDHNIGVLKGLAKGIAAAKKGGIDVSSLTPLIAAIDSKKDISSATGNVEGLHSTVASLEDRVIAYRQTGQTGEKGSGELAVNTLANNSQNESGKNIVGADFGKLKERGVDIDGEAEGANVSGAAMVNIASALIEQINSEQSNLATAKNNGEISDSELNSRNSDLDKAKERLASPDEMGNLSLVNTASKNYGRQERMTSVYHEEIHKGGVEDEELTEGMAKSLMGNQLYGRNAETGGRHASEIAGLAKNLKDKGMSNGDIMKEVDKEIKSRVNAEGKNPAVRTLNKESGQKEPESEAVAGENEPGKKEDKKIMPTLDTEELQENIDRLSKKFKDFELKSPGLLKTAGAKSGPDSFAFKTLLKKIAYNTRLTKELSTPLEADVVIQHSDQLS